MPLAICRTMNLDWLAQHMGSMVTIAQAAAMRDLLIEAGHYYDDVRDIPETEWLRLLDQACAEEDESCPE